MTLKDIAEMTGVSVSTVSRVLNDKGFGTESVRNKIWDAVRTVNYVPNSAARRLRKRTEAAQETRTKTIICLFGRVKNPVENPYFEHVARAIERQALKLGYVTASTFSIIDSNDGREILEKIQSFMPDGIVVLGLMSDDVRSLLLKSFRNVCYTGQNVFCDEWDQVICDGYSAAQKAVEYLLSIGHKKIAYIGETEKECHYRAYCDVLHKAGIALEKAYVAKCQQTSEGGYKGAGIMLESAANQLPTAVFCSNDIAAIGSIRKLSECGYKIPRDFSIISVDNINLAQYTRPMLTTVSVPMEELGSITAKVLIDRIEKGHKMLMKTVLPSKLIVRESVQEYRNNKK